MDIFWGYGYVAQTHFFVFFCNFELSFFNRMRFTKISIPLGKKDIHTLGAPQDPRQRKSSVALSANLAASGLSDLGLLGSGLPKPHLLSSGLLSSAAFGPGCIARQLSALHLSAQLWFAPP